MKVIDITGNVKRVYDMKEDRSSTILVSTEELNYCPVVGSILTVV